MKASDFFTQKVAMWAFGGLVGLVVVYKAFTISLTHDESASFIYLIDHSVFGALWNSNDWPNANNHLLNTLAFQLSNAIFGPVEGWIRWLSWLSFGAYLYYAIAISRLWSSRYIQWLVFLLLIANPYVLDFFSMARGYAFALTSSLVSLYHGHQFLIYHKNKDMIVVCIALLLGSLSLFSNVILFPAIMGPIFIVLAIHYGKKELSKREFFAPVALMASTALITIVLTIVPILALSHNAEFKWGATTLMESWRNYISNINYGKKYAFNEYFVVGLIVMMILYAYLKTIINWRQAIPDRTIQAKQWMFLSSFGILIALMLLSKGLTDTYYPIDRKTILYAPWGALIVGIAFQHMNQMVAKYASIVLCLVIIAHLLLSVKTDEVREWWYDRDTKVFINKISEDCDGTCSLGTSWFFHPTSTFYTKYKTSNLTIGPYNKELNQPGTFDYFIAFTSDFESLKDKYKMWHQIPEGRCILMRK